jgi:hypothetical protein
MPYFLTEVLNPDVLSRMKQSTKLPRVRIETAQIRAFVQIATRAGQREVLADRLALMLPGNDVLHVKWQHRLSFRQPAVFASGLGPLANQLSQRRIHLTRAELEWPSPLS